jgi:hypothetical protein
LKQKHRVREIVVSALRGELGNTDFEAMSAKNYEYMRQNVDREKQKLTYFGFFLQKSPVSSY